MVGPAEFAQARSAGRQGRPVHQPTGDSTGHSARPAPGSGEGVMAAEQCAPAGEAAYRHYGYVWELTARSP
jgi:hypothetical protein